MTSRRMMLLCHNVHSRVAAATQAMAEPWVIEWYQPLVNGDAHAGTAKSHKAPEIRHIFC
ncbi:hypothetical protein GAY33_17940 [Azospirillum brasilense]|uniref:Uncharacterized protein n=1 Tax=Azospirillum argentinense TaxID=2970906 RepID=A0A2K1G3B9_9PROT|nr:hypothetical protein FH063_004935 [Azospirillum argentinense]MBK3801081.1 hypothetical protein [Azospirillum argentinense]PNQ99288.1 hypothetical protein C1S70_08920 [Azospirillum argentinense]